MGAAKFLYSYRRSTQPMRTLLFPCLLLFIFSSCKNNPQPTVAKQIDDLQQQHFPFDYHKKQHGDSLFAAAVVHNDAIQSFAALPALPLPYGKASQALFEQLFAIQPYQTLPAFPFLKTTNPLPNKADDTPRVYWLTLTPDTATVVEVYVNTLSKEQFVKGNYGLLTNTTWYYPSQHRRVDLTLTVEPQQDIPKAQLVYYLANYHIGWQPYLDLVDTLNQKDWHEQDLLQQLATFFPNRSYRVKRFYETLPKSIPERLQPIQDSLLHTERFFDHYRNTGALFYMTDTLYHEQDTLPIEWEVYIEQFARKI